MRRSALLLGAVLEVLGLFWAGRESTHGLGAYLDHWWCPLPLVAVCAGLACVLVASRPRRIRSRGSG